VFFLGVRFIKVSTIYFIIGIGMGMFMSISHKFQYAPAHAHINLLGWTSLALIGIVYHFFPSVGNNLLAKISFWFYNIGLPIMMIGLVILESGNNSFESVIAVGASLTSIGVICFVINVFANIRKST
jgi:cbb3-type cytochrome oxidase subunit 1